jgi:hypothetical protein
MTKSYLTPVVFDPQAPVQELVCPHAGVTVFASVWCEGQVAGSQTSVLAFFDSFLEPFAFTNKITTHAIIKIVPIPISTFFISVLLNETFNITKFLSFYIYMNVNPCKIFKFQMLKPKLTC